MRGNCPRLFIQGKKSCRILSLEECHDGKGLGGLSKGTCLRTKLGKAIALEGVSWGQLLEVSCSGENYSRIIVQDKGSWALVPTDFHVGQLSGRHLSGEWLFRKQCPGVKNPWGTCPGGNFNGDVVRGICPVGNYSGETIWEKFHGGNFLGAVAQGESVNGNCPGEIS